MRLAIKDKPLGLKRSRGFVFSVTFANYAAFMVDLNDK